MTASYGLPTTYRGFTFRSRLEARWALFLDELHVPWQYEPDGWDLPDGPYVPDFWLPREKLWLEIKPNAKASISKPLSLSQAQDRPVLVAIGMPGESPADQSEIEAFLPPGPWRRNGTFLLRGCVLVCPQGHPSLGLQYLFRQHVRGWRPVTRLVPRCPSCGERRRVPSSEALKAQQAKFEHERLRPRALRAVK